MGYGYIGSYLAYGFTVVNLPCDLPKGITSDRFYGLQDEFDELPQRFGMIDRFPSIWVQK